MNRVKRIEPKNPSYRQGYYIPKNSHKYIGDLTKIIFRSSWERRFMMFCDYNEFIINWSSETLQIPYLNPLDHKKYNYYPDFLIKNYKNEYSIIEIKPYKQTLKPTMRDRDFKNLNCLSKYNKEMMTFIVNIAKWSAAHEFAKYNKMKFYLITENDAPLKIKKRKKI